MTDPAVASLPDQTSAVAAPPTVSELFFGFLGIGLMGFGGVLPLARRMLVEDKKWLTPDAFTTLLGLCQFLPGGNIINMSAAVGYEFRGLRGAVAALVGLIAAPTVIVIALGVVYDRYRDDPMVRDVFTGLAAAAAGLLLATAIKMLRPILRSPLPVAVAAVTVAAIAWFRLPLVLVLAVISPVSILLAWRFRP